MQWYYVDKGKRQGPVDDAAIKALIADGTLSHSSKAWNASMGSQWKHIGAIPELGGADEYEAETLASQSKKGGLRFSTQIRKRREDATDTNISRGNVEFASVNANTAEHHHGTGFLKKCRAKANGFFVIAGLVGADYALSYFNILLPSQLGIFIRTGFVEYGTIAIREGGSFLSTNGLFLKYGIPGIVAGYFLLTGFLSRKAIMPVYLIGMAIYLADLLWLLFCHQWVACIIHAAILQPLVAGYAAGKRYKVRN